MIDASVGFAFAAGLVAAFNPCGFAMLPAYLSIFLGLEGGREGSATTGVGRALRVAAAVSLGFVLVFGLVGLVLSRVSLGIVDYAPWLTVVIGGLLVPLGVAMALGFRPGFKLPMPSRGPAGQGLASMFGYGVSYAVVSLSCTLPVFLAAVSGTFTRSSFGAGMVVFGAYAAGMGLVLWTLTLALALARNTVVTRLRRVLPYVNRVSGALLVVAGAYVVYYGFWELRIASGAAAPAGPVSVVSGWSGWIEGFVSQTGAGSVGLAMAAVVLLVLGLLWRRSRSAG